MTGIDKIICINLIDRPDKYNNAKRVFDKLNLHVDFYQPEKHKYSGRIGCFESHINVIKECFDQNMNRILIFEDDIIETSSYNKDSIQNIIHFLDNNVCDYFQLGYTILPHEMINYFTSLSISNTHFLQYNGNCTHAYILNRTGMEKILKTWKKYCYNKKLDIDVYYKEIFKNNGACSCPILFDQNFCINNDNEIATTSYYTFMRSFSCVQYHISFMYYLSIIRYQYLLILSIILLVCLLKITTDLKLFSKLKFPKFRVKV